MQKLLAVAGAVAAAVLATADTALAQQPRCGGYPPTGRGHRMHSVLIGYVGQPCYGQIFAQLGRRGRRGRSGVFGPQVAISSVEVVRPPAHGRFEMIGLRDFRYTPSASLKGWDKIVVRYLIERRGERRPGRVVFRATTQEYALTHGTTPPRGEGQGRRRGRFR